MTDDDVVNEVVVTATHLSLLACSISMSFIDKGFGGKRFTIRGINDTAINGTGAPIVASYIDETPLIAQAASATFTQNLTISTHPATDAGGIHRTLLSCTGPNGRDVHDRG